MSDVLDETRDGRWKANLWEIGRLWYEAEWDRSPPVPWTRLPQPGKEDIYDRIRSVLGGSIPEAELGAGDVAALVGDWNAANRGPLTQYVTERFASLVAHDASPDTNAGEPRRIRNMRERRLSTFWDCIAWRPRALVEKYSKTMGRQPNLTGLTAAPSAQNVLFGNTHVGMQFYTNLQVSGQLASDQTFVFSGWWITTSVGHDAIVRRLLGSGIATIRIGEMPQFTRHMSDLARDKHPIYSALPVRQNFAVDFSFFGAAFENASRELAARVEETGEEFCIWANFEGLQTRDIR